MKEANNETAQGAGKGLCIRVGMGYDVHQLVEGRDLWLGGIKIEHTLGLLGHSDADGSFPGVFQRIGQQLFNHKGKPLFIRDQCLLYGHVVQGQPAADEFRRELAHRRTDDIIQRHTPAPPSLT